MEIKGHFNGSHLKVILSKMCWFANTKFEDVDFNDKTWFHMSTWDEVDQYLFIQWLRLYLRYNSEAQIELGGKKFSRVGDIKKLSEQFTYNYGWKVNGDSIGKFGGQLK